MIIETKPSILNLLENGTYFDVNPKDPLPELIYESIDDIQLEGIFETPEKQKFDLEYCNTAVS